MSDPTTNMEDDIMGTVSALKSYGKKLTGWSYNEDDSIESNITALVDGLIDQVQSSATRIQTLHIKLGQLAEKL